MNLNNYGKLDFGPPQHKLHKIMSSYTVEVMLSQSESRFDFRSIMDEGSIFIANLSRLGPEPRDLLGKFILAFIHLAALSRSTILPELRKPFHVYADEAHRFVGATVEDMITDTRKYNVSLTLAHQHLKQLSRETLAALGVMGSTITFKVGDSDSERMAKILGGQVRTEDLTSLGVGEAIARIDANVIRINTPRPPDISDTTKRDRVVKLSRERYCKPVSELEEELFGRYSCRRPSKSLLTPGRSADLKEFTYAEL
jgi:hypothetical protein